MLSKEGNKEDTIKRIEEGESCEAESGAHNGNNQLDKQSSIIATIDDSKKKDVQKDNARKYNYKYNYNYNFGNNYHYEYNYDYKYDFNHNKNNNKINSNCKDHDKGNDKKELLSVNTATCTAANTCTNTLDTTINTATGTNTTVTCPKANNRTGEKTEMSFTAFRSIEKKYKLYQMPKREARRN